mmetsp:Transcript_20686/g.23743  ORF Transcript_20686/g.23743 Transcript_20686/m.23743 type:complete len:712 (-) Transcript_20686:118-2253(-)
MMRLLNSSALALAIAIFTRNASSFSFTPLISHKRTTSSLHASSSTNSPKKTIVIISPPGGIGEVTAVETAKLGHVARWFVISKSNASQSSVRLSSETLSAISDSGGSLDLAGATTGSLLLEQSQKGSAVKAVGSWCRSTVEEINSGKSMADGLVCTLDGCGTEDSMKDAIKIAVREACATLGASNTMKLAVLPIRGVELKEYSGMYEEEEELPNEVFLEETGGKVGEVSKLVGSVFGGVKRENTPDKIGDALGVGTVSYLRHGNLFGVPESSAEASPFVNGPRREPILRDEYTMRAIRLDPTLSMSGNTMITSDETRSSRLSVGSTAARMVTSLGERSGAGLDICLASLRGTDELDDFEWEEQIKNVVSASTYSSSSPMSSPTLFSIDFESVPDTERLADWLATKWAPAILRTYDIAGIRVGSRPVYAARTERGKVEIVWEELTDDFRAVKAGRMVISVDEGGILATREGIQGVNVSSRPLPGEDMLVRKLADAAAQACDKGLAQRKRQTKPKKQAKIAAPPPLPTASTTLVEPVTASATAVVEAPPVRKKQRDSGPRTKGARRSSERTRGGSRVKKARGSELPDGLQPTPPTASAALPNDLDSVPPPQPKPTQPSEKLESGPKNEGPKQLSERPRRVRGDTRKDAKASDGSRTDNGPRGSRSGSTGSGKTRTKRSKQGASVAAADAKKKKTSKRSRSSSPPPPTDMDAFQ